MYINPKVTLNTIAQQIYYASKVLLNLKLGLFYYSNNNKYRSFSPHLVFERTNAIKIIHSKMVLHCADYAWKSQEKRNS